LSKDFKERGARMAKAKDKGKKTKETQKKKK
jgi:hypothetical protein